MEFIVALTNGVELSENAAGIMAGAEALARQRGHHIIGSEHVIYVMIQKDNRAMQWIANTIFPEDTDAVLIFRNLVTECESIKSLYGYRRGVMDVYDLTM